MFLGAPLGVAAQPPEALGLAPPPEADPDPTLVSPSLAELPPPLPMPLDDVRVLAADALDDALDVGVQHSSSAGPGQSPGVET